MKLVDAFLALALTLGVFACGATLLVELFHRAAKSRIEGLRRMLGTVFDRVLAEPLKEKGIDTAALRAEFVGALATDSTLTTLATDSGKAKVAGKLTAASGISIDDALRRLARSAPLKEALRNLDADKLEKALRDMVDAYNRAEQASTRFFTNRARFFSYISGIFIAVAINVDAMWMLDFYAGNPDATRQTIAQLQALKKDAQTPDKEKAPAATPADAKPAPLGTQVQDLINDLQSLGMVGVPVGWSFYPYCVPADGRQIDRRCKTASETPVAKTDAATSSAVRAWLGELRRANAAQAIVWVISVAVTGILIGLGGPFWFDVAMSLSRIRELLKTGAKAEAPAPAVSTVTIDARIGQTVRQVLASG